MKYFFVLYWLCQQSPLKAQYPVNMNNYLVSDFTTIKFINSNNNLKFEIPPWTIAGRWHTYLIVNGSACYTFSSPDNLITNNILNCKKVAPKFAVGPVSFLPWKRNYCSIYSAHFITHPIQGNINIGFCHNENKNGCHQQNTINPLITPLCGTTTDFSAYFAMVSAVWTPNNENTNWGQKGYDHDLGPILCPSAGYVAQDNSNATEGLLQPSSIINGDYIYIFIWDKGALGNAKRHEGKSKGIKVVRTTIANSTNPSLYEVYYKSLNGVVQWLPSLPIGFTKETMLQYLKTPGPKSTSILTDEISGNTQAFRFAVAKVKNKDYFIGCEEYIDNSDSERHHIALRFSYNLIDWSPRKKIIETSKNWDASRMNYPIFLSADGWTNTEIDLNDFYLIGTNSQSPFSRNLNRLHITLNSAF